MTAHRQALSLTPKSEIEKTDYRGWRIARHEDGLLLDGEEAAPRWIASNKRHSSMIVKARNSGSLLRWIDEYEHSRLPYSVEESGRLWSKFRTGASLAKLAQRHNVSVGFETEHGHAMMLGANLWHGRGTVLSATIFTILLAVLCVGFWWLFGGLLRPAFSGAMWLFSPAGSDAVMWIAGAMIVLWLCGVVRPWR